MAYILVDIGATSTRMAVSADARSYGEVATFNTPLDYQKALTKIKQTLDKLTTDTTVTTVIGVRGQLDDDKQSIVHDTILTDWIDQPLVADMERITGGATYIENNAALAGLGEATYGAGEGHEIVVYHTISTGVGGVKVEAGRLDANRGNFEPGQQILDIDHTILGEDIEPTLENLVSAQAVTKRMGMNPMDIEQSDAVWDQLAYFLAHGLRNSILYWSPDVLVLGGPMMLGNPHIDIDAVISYTNDVVGDVTEVPLIVKGTFADEVVIQGALAYINQVL